jgi:hypothetical protein
MWRWARWVLAGLVVAVAPFVSYIAWSTHKQRLKQQVRDAGYEQRVESMRKAYPPGTARAVVEKGLGLKASQPDYLDSMRVDVLLAQDSSTVWYCSTFDTYAVFKFEYRTDYEAEPLRSIELEQRGVGCM